MNLSTYPRMLLTGISWFVRSDVSAAKDIEKIMKLRQCSSSTSTTPINDALSGKVDVNPKQFEVDDAEIELPGKQITIRFPVDRYHEIDSIEKTFTADGDRFTIKELLQHIHDFYHTPVDRDLIQKISQTDDGWGYSDIAKEKHKNGEEMHLEEIMGDCMHFEGLDRITETEKGTATTKYMIYFGS